MVVDAALQVSLSNMDAVSELEEPSKAIKLKYDLKRSVNLNYAFLMKKEHQAWKWLIVDHLKDESGMA